jgi:hypothetical protein
MREPDRPKSGVMSRCVIYTRKSSDARLEQEFNSLDAQRETCRPTRHDRAPGRAALAWRVTWPTFLRSRRRVKGTMRAALSHR